MRPLCHSAGKVNKHNSHCVVDDGAAAASAIITLDCIVLHSSLHLIWRAVACSVFGAAVVMARQQTETEFKTERKM